MRAEQLRALGPSGPAARLQRHETPVIVSGSLGLFLLVWQAIYSLRRLSHTTPASSGAVSCRPCCPR
jgi:hypothetical protein